MFLILEIVQNHLIMHKIIYLILIFNLNIVFLSTDLPVAMSSPHFYGRQGIWNNQFEGFTPNEEDHRSYAIIEPISGISLDQRARSQSNMVLPKLLGFRQEINRFSEFVIPLVWIEYVSIYIFDMEYISNS